MANPKDYPQLDYDNYNPFMYAHKKKIARIDPSGSYNQTLGFNDVVRFNIPTGRNDYMDPYNCYFQFTVSVAGNTALANDAITNKVVQIDGSGHSIINEFKVYNDSNELERIMDYDVLMTILKDFYMGIDKRYSRDYEGYGGSYPSSFGSPAFQSVSRPIQNDGQTKSKKGYFPDQQQHVFIDDNTSGNFTTSGFQTQNHVEMFNQYGFTPFYNPSAMTYSGTDDRSSAINWSKDTGPYYTAFLNGTSHPYQPPYCAGTGEPILSQTVGQRILKNGFLSVETINEITFQIPVMSAFFGMLMPPHLYKLIPLKYFNNFVYELTLNPYFLFTSWTSNSNSARSYNVKRVQLVMDIIEVLEPTIIANSDSDFQKKIVINSKGWTTGPKTTITNGAVPPTLQINLGFESLLSGLLCFIPNDFSAQSCCRKQYRLSMGITSLQAKNGTEYYPQLPITGNGGTNYGPVNNYDFIKNTFKVFDLHCNPDGIINPYNFAINCRAVDPTNLVASYTSQTQGAIFSENQVVGKAVYGISFNSSNPRQNLLGGINTMGSRPFELQLNYDNSKVFTRAVTCYTFFWHDTSLVISPEGISVLGKA